MAAPTTEAPPLPYGSALRCEQLVYTWAPHTLTTVNGGMGVVGVSAGWPTEHLAGWYDYIPSELLIELDHRVGPVSLARHVTPHGVLVVRKTPLPATSHGRPGNYLAHAVLDRSGRLSASDALSLYDSPLLRYRWDEEDVVALPQLDVPTGVSTPAALPPADLTGFLPVLVEATLVRLAGGAPVVLRLPDERQGVDWLGHLAAALPERLAAQLTFSTYEPRPTRDGPMVVLWNEAFQDRPVPRSTTSLTGGVGQPTAGRSAERAAAVELVRLYVEGRPRPAVVDHATTVAELLAALRHHRIASTPVTELDGDQLADLLRFDTSWLRRSLPDALRRAVDEPLPISVLELIAAEVDGRADGERVELLDTLVREEAAARVRRGGRSHAGPLLELLGVESDQLAARLVDVATERLRAGALQATELQRVWGLVTRYADRISWRDRHLWLALSGVPSRLAQDDGWSELTATLVEMHLTQPHHAEEQRVAVGLLVARFEEEMASIVEWAVRNHGAHDVVHRLLRAAPRLGPGLLLRCDLPGDVLLGEVLPMLPDEQLLAVLQRDWPELGVAAGLPRRIAALLRPVDDLRAVPGRDADHRRLRLPGRGRR